MLFFHDVGYSCTRRSNLVLLARRQRRNSALGFYGLVCCCSPGMRVLGRCNVLRRPACLGVRCCCATMSRRRSVACRARSVARAVRGSGVLFCNRGVRCCLVCRRVNDRCFMRRRRGNGLAQRGKVCDADQCDCLEYYFHFFPRYRDLLIRPSATFTRAARADRCRVCAQSTLRFPATVRNSNGDRRWICTRAPDPFPSDRERRPCIR